MPKYTCRYVLVSTYIYIHMPERIKLTEAYIMCVCVGVYEKLLVRFMV